MNGKIFLVLLYLFSPLICNAEKLPFWSYKVVKEYPHDKDAFTQGLFYDGNGILYEGTGLNGRTTLRKVELETGVVLKQYKVASNSVFGEGIVAFGDSIYQLTWRNRIIYKYDKATFSLQGIFPNANENFEGWGLTHDGTSLIMSDGSAFIYFLDPQQNLTITKRIEVKHDNDSVTFLNELEYINGEIWANIWQSDYIMTINPESGNVTAVINFHNLLPSTLRAGADVLNGIAYDEAENRIFVTGKLWPRLYEVKIISENGTTVSGRESSAASLSESTTSSASRISSTMTSDQDKKSNSNNSNGESDGDRIAKLVVGLFGVIAVLTVTFLMIRNRRITNDSASSSPSASIKSKGVYKSTKMRKGLTKRK